jgi:hypothetical protein
MRGIDQRRQRPEAVAAAEVAVKIARGLQAKRCPAAYRGHRMQSQSRPTTRTERQTESSWGDIPPADAGTAMSALGRKQSLGVPGRTGRRRCRALIDNPTLGNPEPATPGGTSNNAKVGFDNFVMPYLTNDSRTGQPLVVNIAGSEGLFGPVAGPSPMALRTPTGKAITGSSRLGYGGWQRRKSPTKLSGGQQMSRFDPAMRM